MNKNNVIDGRMSSSLGRLVFYRNLLSHEYFDITFDQIFDVMQGIGLVKEFVAKIKEAIKS
ncbi:MAG: hypothetical protein J4432_05155 [DPANN group archaeon]|nr:hypothetical protein [DPANN group archaeon]